LFVNELLGEIVMGEESLAVAATNAYGKTLRRYHGWIVRGVFSLAMKSVPYRQDLLAKLGPADSDTVSWVTSPFVQYKISKEKRGGWGWGWGVGLGKRKRGNVCRNPRVPGRHPSPPIHPMPIHRHSDPKLVLCPLTCTFAPAQVLGDMATFNRGMGDVLALIARVYRDNGIDLGE